MRIAQGIQSILGHSSEKTTDRSPGNDRLNFGLLLMTWIPAFSLPFELWPYLLSVPILFSQGMSRVACAWSLVNIWIWLGTPSAPGKGFLLLKAILPVVIGSAAGRLIRSKNQCIAVFFATMVPFCLLALFQWISRIPALPSWMSGQERWILPTRVTSVYYNPNLFAGILLFLLPLGLVWTLMSERSGSKRLVLGWLALTATALVLTFSFGAWTAALFSITLLAAVRFSKHPKTIVLFVVGSAIAILIAIGLFHGSTASYRWAIWREVWHVFQKHPGGIGPGALRQFLALSRAPSDHAHNLYLQTITETGLFGLAIILWVVVKVFRRLLRSDDFWQLGAAAALSGLLLYGLVDYIWAAPLLTGLFWLGEGLLEEPP